MRLKSFSAPTMALAMAQVRKELGADAVIVSTRNGGQDAGVTVMAAIEERVSDTGPDPFSMNVGHDNALQAVDDILCFHRVPPSLADALRAAADSLEADTPATLLAGALDMHFRFRSLLPLAEGSVLVIMGPAGAGKTVTAAKIAAASLLAGRPVRLVNADTARAGAGARLRALAERIEVPIDDAPDHHTLQERVAASHLEVVVVDAPGVNPFHDAETQELRDLLAGVNAMRLLVLPAGCDAMEAIDQAQAFAALGAEALIVSRLDASVRYGGTLAAAHAASLPFSGAGIQPQIGDGLMALNPVSLARVLAARCDGVNIPLARREHAA